MLHIANATQCHLNVGMPPAGQWTHSSIMNNSVWEQIHKNLLKVSNRNLPSIHPIPSCHHLFTCPACSILFPLFQSEASHVGEPLASVKSVPSAARCQNALHPTTRCYWCQSQIEWIRAWVLQREMRARKQCQTGPACGETLIKFIAVVLLVLRVSAPL